MQACAQWTTKTYLLWHKPLTTTDNNPSLSLHLALDPTLDGSKREPSVSPISMFLLEQKQIVYVELN